MVRACRPIGLWFLATFAVVLLFGCATSGVAEFQTYRTAYEATYATSTAILDQVAIQERVIARRIYRISASSTFDPDLAAYYTDSVDPPGTAGVRRAVATVKTYNDLLYGLASGQTAEALVARVATLNATLQTSLDSTVALATAGAGSASIAPAEAAFNTAFTQLRPLLEVAMKYRSRQEFRRFLVENYPLVREMLVALREGTAAIFPILVDELLRAPDGDDAKVAAYRKLVADWVVLIDVTIAALDVAVAAAQSPATLGSTITGITTVAVDMQVAADTARKHLAEVSVK
jgi:hypothetical protein